MQMPQSQEWHTVKAPSKTVSDTHLGPHLLLLSLPAQPSLLFCKHGRLFQPLQLCTWNWFPLREAWLASSPPSVSAGS